MDPIPFPSHGPRGRTANPRTQVEDHAPDEGEYTDQDYESFERHRPPSARGRIRSGCTTCPGDVPMAGRQAMHLP